MRPRHSGCGSFQNAQRGLGPTDYLCFQAQLGGLPSWFKRAIKQQLAFLLLDRSFPAKSALPVLGVTLSCSSHAPVWRRPLVCLSPRWLSHRQDAAEFRGMGWSRTWRCSGNAVVSPGLNYPRTSYFIHGLFCDGLLTAIMGHLKALKRERLKSSP